jgi:hypothetical protein
MARVASHPLVPAVAVMLGSGQGAPRRQTEGAACAIDAEVA